MAQVQADEVLAVKLGGLDSTVELRDSQGVTVGHYLPEAKYMEMLQTALKNFTW